MAELDMEVLAVGREDPAKADAMDVRVPWVEDL